MSSRTTASNLRTRSNRSAIADIIKTHTRLIDIKIENAHAKGRDMIKYELPTTFSLPNMDKVDQQLLVYSELIKLYSDNEPDGRGMNVTYEVIDDDTRVHILKISWLNGMSDNERSKRKEILKNAKR
jgi:hypothetical protein